MAPNYRSLIPGGFFSSTPYERTIPVSIRCNNPGAINGASWEMRYPGYVDTVETTPGNKTTIFEAPEYGVAVWWELLRRYAAANIRTVGGIINRYGGGQDYSNYIRFVAKKTGYDEQKKIRLDDDTVLLAFGKAMFHYEAGRPTPLSDEQIIYGLRLGRSDGFVADAATGNDSFAALLKGTSASEVIETYSRAEFVVPTVSMPDTTKIADVQFENILSAGDAAKVPRLVEIGGNPDTITQVQTLAARTMASIGYQYPRKSCAATLSHFLRTAGINVPVTTGAQNLADRLRFNRKWTRIGVGSQQPGDVGVCESNADDVPGADHIYLVVNRVDDDLMIIADNQFQGNTHKRNASGKPVSGTGRKTPTEYFLRASESGATVMAFPVMDNEEAWPDEHTNDLPEPFMDDGTPRFPTD